MTTTGTSSIDDKLEVPERRIPQRPWGRVWLATVALVLGAFVGLELFVRARGYEPSIKDDAWAWAHERARVADGSADTVAILGGSRILLAFDMPTFRQLAPRYAPVQLAINGSQPIGTLRDLAADPDFRGVALVDTSELGFLPRLQTTQHDEVAAYHRRWRAPGAMLERWLATQVQARFALVSAAGVRALEGVAVRGAWPAPRYVVTHADRTRYANYALADVARLRRAHAVDYAAGGTQTPSELEARLAEALELEPAIAQIQARGGQVVYLRMPTCGPRWLADEALYPKARFWDRLAAQTRAVAIHFQDHPALAGFECPDLSHLDSKDGPRFTRGLVEVLLARGVLTRD